MQRRWAYTALAAGFALLLLTTWLNRPAEWRRLLLQVDGTAAVSRVELDARGEYELALEAGENANDAVLAALTTAALQTGIDAHWNIACNGNLIAAGGTRDYLRLLPVRGTAGKARRVLGRVPFGQDETSYWTFGLGGDFLAERVVGRFVFAGEDSTCDVSWEPEAVSGPLRFTVRRSYEEWSNHNRAFSALAYGSFMLLGGAGILLASLRLLRPRGHS